MSRALGSGDQYASSNSGGAFFPKVDGLSSDGTTGSGIKAGSLHDPNVSSASSYPKVYHSNGSSGGGHAPLSGGFSSPSYTTSTTTGYGAAGPCQPGSSWSGMTPPSTNPGGYGPPSIDASGTTTGLQHSAGYPAPFSSAPGGYSSSGGGALPVPGGHSSSGAYSAGPPASYPAVGPVGGPPAPQQQGGVPMSAPVGLGGGAPVAAAGSYGVPGGGYGSMGPGPLGQPCSAPMSAPVSMAAPQAAHLAASALASVQPQQPPRLSLTGAAASAAALPSRPQLGEDLFCSCPMVCVVGTNQGAPHAVPLNIMTLQFNVTCHIAQAFVDLQVVCQYPRSWNDAPLVLFLPKTTDTTITELVIENMVRASVFATAIIPREDLRHFGGGKAAAGAAGPGQDPEETLAQDPEMFMLPLPPGLPGDQYRVKMSYFHPMAFEIDTGCYVLRLPTTIPPVCLAQGTSANSVLDVSVTVNTGSNSDVDMLVPSHPVKRSESQPGHLKLELDTDQVWDNVDFVGGYKVWRESLTATVHVEAPTALDQRGTFALSITPPGPEHCVAFPRSVVFAFDRSGSMTGDPIRYAKAALLTGLHMLGEQDLFTVVAFDHEQLWWTDRLIEATPENKLKCMHWVNDDLSARGTTDIHGPLQRALKLLTGAQGLPFIFLLTDGCVDDERQICHMAEAAISDASRPAGAANASIVVTTDGGSITAVNPSPPPAAPAQQALAPRIFTFGIGPYCNHYFLKRLAAIGRGMNDAAFRPHAIQTTMEHMLAAAALPMLSDVQISVQGLSSVELYPFPIPDVFVGQPLLVSGKFEGSWPDDVEICGTLPDGSSHTQTVPSLSAVGLPLHKVFMKHRLDLMASNAWLAGDPPQMVQQIIDLSVSSGVPSAYTAVVGFETTPERYQAMQSQLQGVPASERRKKIAKWAIGGAVGVGAVAGVAAALAFGDLLSTAGNLPVGDAMAAMGGDLGAVFGGLGDSMDCCGGGCDCCGDCGEVCGACLTC